jgi:hypothetical protein
MILIIASSLAVIPAARGAGGWTVVTSPNQGSQDNVLASVAVGAANDVWAVGQFAPDENPNITRTLVNHFDGTNWSLVASPNVGERANALLGVAAKGGNAWAVGYYFDAGFAPRSLIELWDGTKWSVVDHPQPGAGDWLFGVSAVSPTEVWAVGFQRDRFGSFATLIERFDGKRWSTIHSPNPGAAGNQLYGVVAVASDDVWAVGQQVGLRGPDRSLVEHWDGRCWSVVSTPGDRQASTQLFSVSALQNGRPRAVGDSQDNVAPAGVLAESSDHGRFTVTSAANAGAESHLYGVAAVAGEVAWAVGGFVDPVSGNFNTLIEQSSASGFTPVSSANATQNGNNILSSVAAVSATEAWAVGTFDGANARQTLILHFNQ